MSRKIIDNSNIFQRFEKVRNYYNLTQSEFAEKLEITHSYYSGIKRGKSGFSFRMIVGMINNFDNIDIYWLITGVGDMIKSNQNRIKENQLEYSKNIQIDELINHLYHISKKKQKSIISLFKAILELFDE